MCRSAAYVFTPMSSKGLRIPAEHRSSPGFNAQNITTSVSAALRADYCTLWLVPEGTRPGMGVV
jgi:hypothetical protein